MAIMQVPIVKAKGSFLEFDTEKLPEAVYAEALLLGLKTLANRGTSKVTVKDLGSQEDVEKEAMVIAEQQRAKIMSGDITFSGKKAAKGKAKGDKAVTVEAMRLAKDRVRDALRAAGKNPTKFKAAQITTIAEELLAADPSIYDLAKENLDKRAQTPTPVDIAALIAGAKEDATLVKKAEAKKAAAKQERQLSAATAGQVKGRKPKAKPEARA